MDGSAAENVTKLSFASKRMQAAERAHNFVDFCLQTTSTVSEVSRCRSAMRYASSPLRRTLRIWDVKQSPFTVVEIEVCGRRPPLLSKPHGLLRSFSLTGTIFLSIQSLCSYSVEQITSTNHHWCGFYLNFYWRLASLFNLFIFNNVMELPSCEVARGLHLVSDIISRR